MAQTTEYINVVDSLILTCWYSYKNFPKILLSFLFLQIRKSLPQIPVNRQICIEISSSSSSSRSNSNDLVVRADEDTRNSGDYTEEDDLDANNSHGCVILKITANYVDMGQF